MLKLYIYKQYMSLVQLFPHPVYYAIVRENMENELRDYIYCITSYFSR